MTPRPKIPTVGPPGSIPPAIPSAAPSSAPPDVEPTEMRPPPLATVVNGASIPAEPPEGDLGDEADVYDYENEPIVTRRAIIEQSSSFFGSMAVHMVLLIALATINMSAISESFVRKELEPLVVNIPPDALTPEDLRQNEEFDQQMTGEISEAVFNVSMSVGSDGVGSGNPILNPALNAEIYQNDNAGAEISINRVIDEIPSQHRIAAGVPEGAVGDANVIVGDYEQAFDQITEEILTMLSRSKVLVIWCFDQSGSMEDDRMEVQERIAKVYEELGLRHETKGDALTSAVTSYGQGYIQHTRKPTSDVDEITQHVRNVPNDDSGKEMMCSAIARSIADHARYAEGSHRKVALILVTDESGERDDNFERIEQTIAFAKQAKSTVYVLGREAVFGYTTAHMRWRHPQTGRTHWLPIDRGPETPLVQQLQTDGFHKRTDAHPSGFGPYEQCRLARETGGVFFMLPSLETDLVRGEKREYELEAMRGYKPDLRQRQQALVELTEDPLKGLLSKVIDDLNPYKKEVADVMNVRMLFSPEVATFMRQMEEEARTASQYLTYLDAAVKTLDSALYHRDQEESPRWQANYDLMLGQLLAYIARRYEYVAALDHFMKNPQSAPMTKPGFLRFNGWRVRPTRELLGEDRSGEYIVRSTEVFEQILIDHPGTPWAARAEWELKRGFGFRVGKGEYNYYGPRRNNPGVPAQRIEIPKL